MRYFTVSVLIGAVFMGGPIAHAGFKFTGPAQTQSPQIGGLLPSPNNTPMPAVPATPVVQEQVPEPSTRADEKSSVVQQMPQSSSQTAPQPLVIQQQEPVTKAANAPSQRSISWNEPKMTSSVSSESSDQSDLAVGFGNDLPLVTALEQIVPDGYTYVMDPDLTVGQKVSWQGGQAWPAVLESMVNPLGYQVNIEGRVVRITGNTEKSPSRASVPEATRRPQQIASYTPPTSQPAPIMTDAPQRSPIPLMNQKSEVYPSSRPYEAAASSATSPIFHEAQAQPIKMASVEAQEVSRQKTVVPDVTQGQWTALSGASLKTVLQDWSNIEGVDLFWSSDYDYPLVGDVNITGTYEEAVQGLLEGFSEAKPRPIGRLHPNLPHGPAVLLIETGRLAE